MNNQKNQYLNQISKKFKTLNEVKNLDTLTLSPGEQIQLIRKTLGMTQTQLAKRLGYESYVPVAKIETLDNKNPTIETLKNYADALECKLLISFLPKKEIKKVIEELAEKKAREIINLSSKSSALELQKPGSTAIKNEIEELKNEIIEKRRSILWDD